MNNNESKEIARKFGTDYYHFNGICCHAPVYDTVEPNGVYKVYCRNSSKYKGREFELSLRGEEGRVIDIGKLTLVLTKKDN